MRLLTFALFLCTLFVALCHTAGSELDQDAHETICVNDRRPSLQFQRRADDDEGGNGGVGVTLPSVGLSLGNITTKLGNINLTVTNVTIALGNVDIENISIGNITVIVSVPLPGASPITPFSVSSAATSISTSTGTPSSSVVPPTSTSQSAGSFLQHIRRQDSSGSAPPTQTTDPAGPPTVTVGGGSIDAGAGNVDTEIGDINIFVGNVHISLGDVNITNVTIGNIFVLVQIGQPDLIRAIGNLTNGIGAIGSGGD
ncbi:hypothetical protein R3P38DRAFT_3130046 [Favolaschia claudopus]|uniref:Uncharacterized protein n=1 Tax=Favolaschia claudopus TaxID=2862362 RepID=A0AAV9Z9V0_9AGAR